MTLEVELVSFKEVTNLLGDCLNLRSVGGSVWYFCNDFWTNHISLARQRFFQEEHRKYIPDLTLLWMLRFEKLLGETDLRVYQRQVSGQCV